MSRPWTLVRMREFFPRLSIASVSGKQHLSEVVCSARVDFSLQGKFTTETQIRQLWSNFVPE